VPKPGLSYPAKRAGPIDRIVGSRIRARRHLLGVSQTELGRRLGISFQQVQKYENGSNRVGASRLQQIAQALGTTPSSFFDGAPGLAPAPASSADRAAEAALTDFLRDRHGAELIRHWPRLPSHVRAALVRLAAQVAGG